MTTEQKTLSLLDVIHRLSDPLVRFRFIGRRMSNTAQFQPAKLSDFNSDNFADADSLREALIHGLEGTLTRVLDLDQFESISVDVRLKGAIATAQLSVVWQE